MEGGGIAMGGAGSDCCVVTGVGVAAMGLITSDGDGFWADGV